MGYEMWKDLKIILVKWSLYNHEENLIKDVEIAVTMSILCSETVEYNGYTIDGKRLTTAVI